MAVSMVESPTDEGAIPFSQPKAGAELLRFWNNDVAQNREGVLERIEQVVALTPALSRKREREQAEPGTLSSHPLAKVGGLSTWQRRDTAEIQGMCP
jgi:hypothetical protein